MRYAETGYNLEIDLSRGSIEKKPTDPELTELYLGGLGTNAKILWDRVPPEIDAFSPDNLLIFSTGLLCGTPAPAANRTIVSTISPQNGLMAFSMMGGFWAPELKFAGYDKVILCGKSLNLVYLWINGDRVEIRDASHLHGKGPLETGEIVKKELNDEKVQVAAIGLAGENRVAYASIEHDRSSASRLGIGAVMGDKGLKAIAVRGKKDINVARPEEFLNICNEVLEYRNYRVENPIQGVPPILAGVGAPQEMAIHDEKWHTTSFSWGHARTRRKDFWTEDIAKQWSETQSKATKRLVSCYNCPNKCGGLISYPTQGTSTYLMKCYSKLTYVMAAMSNDLEFGYRVAGQAQEYGMDGFTNPQVMAFAIELYDNGILTDEDMPGFPPKNEDGSDEDRFFWLLDKIAHREGIGDVLADGVYWAARRIGKGAEEYDHNTTKKHEQMVIKLGMLNPIYYILYGTGEKANITQIEGQIPQAPLPKELREDFVSNWPQIPSGKEEKFKQFILDWGDEGKVFPYYPPIDVVCDLCEWQEIMHYIDDATGICAGMSSFLIKPPYHIHNLPRLISSGVGIDMDEDRLWEIASRIRTLVRAINVRRGLRSKDDEPPADHWKKRFPDYEAQLKEEYYKFKGWNSDAIPTRETLDKLKLGYVGDDLEQRGILKNGQDEAEISRTERSEK